MIFAEPERPALVAFLRERPERVASALAGVEVRRALLRLRAGREQLHLAEAALRAIALHRLDEPLLEHAGRLGPPQLRTLDAIHLATALTLGDDLEALVTYDERLARAAAGAGLAVASPR